MLHPFGRPHSLLKDTECPLAARQGKRTFCLAAYLAVFTAGPEASAPSP